MKTFRNLLLVSAVGLAQPVFAQYPKIPQDVQRWSDSLLGAERKSSDEAWAKALPIIEKEAKEGKPYIPWAARPYDLPQANIIAFPGAEGGGAYSFGGRGGKVIVESASSFASRGRNASIPAVAF